MSIHHDKIIRSSVALGLRRAAVGELRQYVLLSFRLDDGGAHFGLTVDQAIALRDEMTKQIASITPVNTCQRPEGSR